MSASEYRAVDAESDLPISAAELAALASQLYAASIRPGPDSPPQTAPVAPRGSVPDTTAVTSAGQLGAGTSDLFTPAVPLIGVGDIYVPAPTSPEPESPPQTVPFAPRGSVPDATAATSFAWTSAALADPYLLPGVADFTSFSVPSAAIVPTLPGVLAGQTAPAAPVGDESSYDFLSGANRVPRLPDEHEVFDVNAVRADFPILKETVNGKPLIWFDNAATTQKPQAVIDRLSCFYAHENSNIHRAAHELAARATNAYEEARDTVRRFIGAAKDEEIVFVRGTTEAINLVAYAWGGKYLLPGDEIVITHLEHHANIVPWQLISQKAGAILKVAPVDDAGNLLMPQFEELMGPRTKLVAVSQVSNALGTVVPKERNKG
jgi:cysteine desulfurase / selenocysteine lyase